MFFLLFDFNYFIIHFPSGCFGIFPQKKCQVIFIEFQTNSINSYISQPGAISSCFSTSQFIWYYFGLSGYILGYLRLTFAISVCLDQLSSIYNSVPYCQTGKKFQTFCRHFLLTIKIFTNKYFKISTNNQNYCSNYHFWLHIC